jgi:hypothetical protein
VLGRLRAYESLRIVSDTLWQRVKVRQQSVRCEVRPVLHRIGRAGEMISGATCGLHNVKRGQMLEPVDGSAKSAFGRERSDVQFARLNMLTRSASP